MEPVQSSEKPVPQREHAATLVVLGMHRSGTSVITRALNLLGVDLGVEQHMHKPRADNPSGFWENGNVVALNDELLSRHGGTWDEPPVLPPYWQFAPELEDCRRRARELIRTEFGLSPHWGWKDPRTCLTLPFWKQFLDPMSYIICLRNPVDVARSLQARDGFATEKSLNLWLLYTEAALVHTAGQRRLFLFYEDFMADRSQELHRLAAFLGPAALAKHGEANRSLDDFIKSDLRHHQTSLLDAVNDSDLAFPVQALQVVLRLYTNLARPADARSGEDDEILQRAIEQLSIRAANAQQESRSHRNQLGELSAKLGEEQQRAQDAIADRERLSKQLAEQEEQLQEHVQQGQRLAAQIAHQESTIQTLLAEKQRLSNRNTELERHIEHLSAEHSQLVNDLARLTASAERTDAELKRTQVELELACAELQWMQSSRFWKLRDRVLSFKRWMRQSKQFLLSIESPARQEVVGTSFDLSGWCVSTGKLRIKSMRAKVGDKAFDGVYGLSRPDVARAYVGVAPVGAAQKSGFQIPIALAPGQYAIQLAALDASDKEHVVSSYAVRIG
jgi:hypothetical protein